MATMRFLRLLLFPKYLPVALAIGIKAIALAPVPGGLESGRRDVPIRTAFPRYGTQVLPEFFERRPANEPVAVVDPEHHETRFKDDDVRDHGIVPGVRVLGNVEILLNLASRTGQKGPVGAEAGA